MKRKKSATPAVRKAKPAKATAASVPAESEWHSGFPIVGIGASAGGLEALEEFLTHVPVGSGMAYVVIQHLDPNRKGMLVALLQRATPMPVVQVKDRTPVAPNCVYVIPPNKDMTILHGVLHLMPPSAPRGLRLPIDCFFASLAQDQREASIGVILSGMGSDGTQGLHAIKEKGGGTFVQDPTSAKFDGMPSSATSAGLADVVAPVEELPERILCFRQNPSLQNTADLPLEDKDQSALEKVFILLRAQTGHDFSLYKKSTLYRRIERRMLSHQIRTIAKYVRYLRENPQEVTLLFSEFLIGVTSFFRDPGAWEQLGAKALPMLFAERPTDGVIRAWITGCSTGEEAYSLAMVFKETVDQLKPPRNLTLQIFATDIDEAAIDKARQGLYPASIIKDVSAPRLRRFFVKEEGGYRVGKEIRDMVIFAPQTVIMDPPFTKLDFLSCRNLLIYLSGDLQKGLIPLFHYSLNPGGILFLGSSETVGAFTNLFAPIDDKARLYRRIESPFARDMLDFPASFLPARAGPLRAAAARERQAHAPIATLQSLADQLVLRQYSPTAVLANDKGSILYISGRSGKYLEAASGAANWNLFAMARDGLRHELDFAFAKALREKQTLVTRGLKVGTNGGTQIIDVTVQPLTEPDALRGLVLVVIADVATPGVTTVVKNRRGGTAESRQVAELEHALLLAREEIGSLREAKQTSQEEYRSANEELQSANEELQSANEEMTTSKEEMQSLNEELHTVNRELQARVHDLDRASSDMSNLLNSTDVATLFLDGALRVRRFTPRAAKIIKLLPGDVGRPFTDLASDLDYPDVVHDAHEVMRTLLPMEKPVAGRNGNWFSVRMMSYRTPDNKIDGLVITFTDVSASKALEATFQSKESQLEQMTACLPLLLWSCGADGACDALGPQWLRYTNVPEAEQIGHGWLQQVHPDDRDAVATTWRQADGKASVATELRLRGASGAYRRFQACATPIRDPRGALVKWYWYALDSEDLRRGAGPGRTAAPA